MHHVYLRGVAKGDVAVVEADYARALSLLESAVLRFGIRCHAWCYLPNHFHMLLTSDLGNLSRAMHWFGTCTAQSFNQRHDRVGHLFQGRFSSRVVGGEDYLLELARYVPLNPVRAGLCSSPEAWPWSSYAATAGLAAEPAFLDTRALIAALGSRDAYAAWVTEGMLSTALDEHGAPLPEPRPTLAELLAQPSEQAIALAHFRHGYSKAAIARQLDISRDQVRNRLAPAT
jgi:REP element-mobilizing transposase RayT